VYWALLCYILGAIVENTLSKDSEGANILCAFNPTQAFLYLQKKLLLTNYREWANMLVIILLHNGYFLKYF